MTDPLRIGVCSRCAALAEGLGFQTWAVVADGTLACTICHDHPVVVVTEKRARLDIAGALVDPTVRNQETE